MAPTLWLSPRKRPAMSPTDWFMRPMRVSSLAVVCSMSVAALVGSCVPMLFARLNIDPAVATGPFVTTAIDIISVYFYFSIATRFLGV
jgi:Mg/Co/Ni transporter MgtE